MIHDILAQADFYRPLHPLLDEAFTFLVKTNLHELAPGKRELRGENLVLMVNDYTTNPSEKCRFEAHRRYTDLQYMVTGEERIGVANVASLAVEEAYMPDRDVAFYRGSGDPITLVPGTFAIFFPHDAHQPGIAHPQPMPVRKIVLKVALSG